MDGFADVYRICAHLDGQGDFADHVTGMGAYHAAAQDFAVTPASMAIRALFGAVVKQQLGHAFVAAVGYGVAGGFPREQALLYLDALGFSLVFGQAHPGYFGVSLGYYWDDSDVECCCG
jgi:hypothetical protein